MFSPARHGFAVLGSVLLLVGACGAPKPIPYNLDAVRFGVGDPQFARVAGSLLGPPLVAGNRVTTLVNGDAFFPAMLGGIASAQKTITLETNLYWSGDIGQQFADALVERARAGVKVHLLIDWFGSSSPIGNRNTIKRQYIDRLVAAGADVHEFHPFHALDPSTWGQLDHRTHRKILVIDGKVAFTGGACIATEWTGHAQDPQHYRDNHYRVEGPVVAQLQAAFGEEWMETTGGVLAGDDYFPELRAAGEQWAQVVTSSANGGSKNMQLLMLLSIAAAEKHIRMQSAYFVPDRLTESFLLKARKRGVKIEVIVPGPHIDEKIARDASRGRWGPLLEAGVEIYEYQPTMLHTKQLIVDDVWVSIGSSNQDNRSYRINSEANLNVLNREFAAEQTGHFEEEKKRSHRITLGEWRARPVDERIRNAWAEMFRSEL